MEEDEGFHPGKIGETGTLLPGRMSPAGMLGIFLVRVGAVIDENIRASDQLDDTVIWPIGAMLAIGYIADRFALPIDPIAGGAIGVIEGRGPDGKAGIGRQYLAGDEIVIARAGGEDLGRDRE